MKSDKSQTLTLIGIALLVVAGLLIYISLSQPKVYESETVIVSNSEQANAIATTVSTEQITEDKKTETPKESANEGTTASPSFPVNINTASVSELAAVPNLGEKRASAIVEYRGVIGKYKDVSQIMNIQGFGEGTYESVAPYLTV